MINKNKFIYFLIFLILFSIFYLFSDVIIKYEGVSLREFKEFELNCGSVIDILIYKDQYIGQSSLRMNASVCYNLAILKVLNSTLLLTSIVIASIFGFKYFNNKKNREDLTDLIKILKNRNNRSLY
ncbi:MAG: hypothetical protein O3A48_04480 [Actinomycetota bacterium]|nr:hypothetical protein [Actinomycetota bacterium]